MKRPSFQFYPADWLRDTALRSCSTGARGLWIDMICFMHEGNPYGHLKVGNKVILSTNLASMVGATLKDVIDWLEELHQAGVYELGEGGQIYSKRMVRDEILRNKRAEGGKLGGNPALKVNHEDNPKVEIEDKQKPTPSSSSSSSSSTKKIKTEAIRPIHVSQSVWDDFIVIRNKVKKPFTETALKIIERESQKAGLTLEQALETCCARGWQGFEASWVQKENGLTKTGQRNATVLQGLTRGLLGGQSNVKLLAK